MRPSDSLELESSESEFEEDESESSESSELEDGEASRLRSISMDREEFLCRRGFGRVLIAVETDVDQIFNMYCYTSWPRLNHNNNNHMALNKMEFLDFPLEVFEIIVGHVCFVDLPFFLQTSKAVQVIKHPIKTS